MKNSIFRFGLMLAAAISAFGQAGLQDVVDDGFTWFEAPVAEVLANNISTNTGWMLDSYVRILGSYPEGSQIKLIVLKAGKPTGTTLCNTGNYHKDSGLFPTGFIWTINCYQKPSATKETGEFEVQVYRVSGGEEKLVRTYKIDVRAINRVPSGQQPGTAPPLYMISRHNETAVSTMYLRSKGHIPYFDYSSRPDPAAQNGVELHFSISPGDTLANLPFTTFSCTVDGKPLTLPGPPDYATEANMKYVQNYGAVYQDRLAPKYKAGIPFEERVQFQMIRILVPLSWGGDRRSNRLWMENHPGAWQCKIEKEGKTWRTWRWTIQPNGRPAPHPEQKGNVNLAANAYLIDMESPPDGAPMDGRIAGPSTSLFYGLPWTSAEGKAMAGRLPKKGNSWPIPSNGVK